MSEDTTPPLASNGDKPAVLASAAPAISFEEGGAFLDALFNNKTREYLHGKGLLSSPDVAKSVSPSEIVSVLKLLCSGANVACPIIQNL